MPRGKRLGELEYRIKHGLIVFEAHATEEPIPSVPADVSTMKHKAKRGRARRLNDETSDAEVSDTVIDLRSDSEDDADTTMTGV